MFWLSLLLVPLTSLLPDICAKVGSVTVRPSESDLVKLAEKGNYSPAPYIDKTLGRLGKIRKDAKNFMTNRQQKSRSSGATAGLSDEANAGADQDLEMHRGYAFSQEEHGAVSQNDLVRVYSREDRRYGSGHPNASTTKLTSISSNSQLGM